MGRFTTSVKVGTFAVVTGAATIGIFRFVDKSGSSGSGYVVHAYFDDATGIAKHSQVKVSGIAVGTIESVRLEKGKARIDIRMQPDVPLHVDATVTKVSSSLLGEYFLGIAPGTDGRAQLKDGDEIPVVVEAVTTDSLMRDMSAISADVRRVTKALAESVGTDEGKENLKATLENLAKVTEALNQTVRENRESIHNILVQVESMTTRGEPEVRQILENVRESTTDIREMLAKPEQTPNQSGGEVRKILDKVDRASSSLESSLGHIDNVTARLDRGEGTLGRLSKDEKLIDEVEGVTETVGEFVGGLARLQTIVSLRTDYQYLTSSVKSYLQLRLQPREDKYYLFEVVYDPRGATTQEQIAVETTNPNQPPVYFERRTVTRNSARFSLQFAQRFGPFTGRFGIKESTGGGGLDLNLFDDRFELQQDLYGFGEVVLPRYRLSLGYEFVKRLWLLGGADDILSTDRRDYFVGLQLRFNDEDLKTMLPFVPAGASGQ
jgi:phospholipid/cholesterol/gamma-HCH transport system substrate-binding protein